MLGAFLLAGDMIATPMRARGQVIFALGAGVLTVFLRLYGPLEAACYWSILIMNWLVPSIDRRMRRPILGMRLT
jgi:electron transport complex protein RnfD